MKTSNIERPEVVQETRRVTHWSGRAVGVGGAVIGAALDIYANGVRPSNIAGGVCGAIVGYVAGDMVDGLQTLTNTTNAPMLGLVGVIGFTTSVGTSMSCRGLDGKDNDTVPELEFN